MSDSLPIPLSPGDNRSGEARKRDSDIVQEIMDITNHKLSKPAQDAPHEAERRLQLADKAVLEAVQKYYKEHPVSTNLSELGRLIMSIYALEFSRWSKDDVITMLILSQTTIAMKKLGY